MDENKNEMITVPRFMVQVYCENERKTSCLGFFTNKEEAWEAMHQDFLSCTGFSDDELDDEAGIEKDMAWYNSNNGNIDWEIIDLSERFSQE